MVERKENELKEDIYPINPEIQKARKHYGSTLLDGGFISKKSMNVWLEQQSLTKTNWLVLLKGRLLKQGREQKSLPIF